MNILTGKSSVDGREGVELVLEQVLVFGVKVASRQSKAPTNLKPNSHSDQLSTVGSHSCSLSSNLRWPNEVLENLLVDGSEGSRSRSFLRRSGTRVSLGFREDSSLREEDDEFV